MKMITIEKPEDISKFDTLTGSGVVNAVAGGVGLGIIKSGYDMNMTVKKSQNGSVAIHVNVYDEHGRAIEHTKAIFTPEYIRTIVAQIKGLALDSETMEVVNNVHDCVTCARNETCELPQAVAFRESSINQTELICEDCLCQDTTVEMQNIVTMMGEARLKPLCAICCKLYG